jgi:hypothetical protein
VSVWTMTRFVENKRMAGAGGRRRRQDRGRGNVPFGIVEAFTQEMMEVIRTIPAGNIRKAWERFWQLDGNGFGAWGSCGCESVET